MDLVSTVATISDILRVMRTLGRVPFLPPAARPYADVDAPLPIGHGQTNSQPSTVAAMLELLEVPVGGSVLDVGAGSGWTTAILGRLVGPSGRVIGVERVPDLTERAAATLATLDMPWAAIRQAFPGRLGWPDGAPYDRILVSADADELPMELVDQLAPGGVMVIPVASVMHRIRREASGRLVDTHHGLYAFVPLIL